MVSCTLVIFGFEDLVHGEYGFRDLRLSLRHQSRDLVFVCKVEDVVGLIEPVAGNPKLWFDVLFAVLIVVVCFGRR
ncbi:hypothetical protein U1Q18_003357 [Sarracenia purpurea var. burkii]